ncbi:DUF4394 domain-containing protein [Streptomyces globisporus]|uniref:DUF4394 domain-containing protein n=1 Tax=Streptomyces globisporus TaxID=1908 RepID=UPI0036FA211F
MRAAVVTVALAAAVSSVVPASAGAWAAAPSSDRTSQEEGSGPGEGGQRAAVDGDLTVIGLTTGQRLVGFRSGEPSRPWQLGKVSGLKKDTKVVGIDFRVQNTKLYGVGDKGGIYTLDTRNLADRRTLSTWASGGRPLWELLPKIPPPRKGR